MTTEKTRIPGSHMDLLGSTALAHVATLGPRGRPHSSPVWMSRKYLGKDEYPNHRPGDERVVIFITPEHTTKKDR